MAPLCASCLRIWRRLKRSTNSLIKCNDFIQSRQIILFIVLMMLFLFSMILCILSFNSMPILDAFRCC
uniref:Uncharacterized protein n=1 Tax=Cannabis sativa TaxID=3483 RepID=A0A803QXB2_CANSA